MERRRAIALAAAGSLIGAASVVAAATGLLHAPDAPVSAAGPIDTAAPPAAPDVVAGPLDPVILTERRDVYDTVMVQTPTPSPAAAGADPGTALQGTAKSSPATKPGGATTTTTTTNQSVLSSPTTTVPSTTTTTRPPGVPSDWPADKPIPPMPPGCQKPQLEDNGVWNCDH